MVEEGQDDGLTVAVDGPDPAAGSSALGPERGSRVAASFPAAAAVARRSRCHTAGATWLRTFDHQQVDGTSSTVSRVTGPIVARCAPAGKPELRDGSAIVTVG